MKAPELPSPEAVIQYALERMHLAEALNIIDRPSAPANAMVAAALFEMGVGMYLDRELTQRGFSDDQKEALTEEKLWQMLPEQKDIIRTLQQHMQSTALGQAALRLQVEITEREIGRMPER